MATVSLSAGQCVADLRTRSTSADSRTCTSDWAAREPHVTDEMLPGCSRTLLCEQEDGDFPDFPDLPEVSRQLTCSVSSDDIKFEVPRESVEGLADLGTWQASRKQGGGDFEQVTFSMDPDLDRQWFRRNGLFIASPLGGRKLNEALQMHSVKTVLLLKEVETKVPGVEYIDLVAIADLDEEKAAGVLDHRLASLVERIDDALKTGHSVLVHGDQRCKRTAAIVTAYVILRHGCSRDEALTTVQRGCRSIGMPTGSLWEMLGRYEESCLETWTDDFMPLLDTSTICRQRHDSIGMLGRTPGAFVAGA